MLLEALMAATAVATPPLAPPAPAAFDTACQVLLPDNVPIEGRKSPLDSITFNVGKDPVKLCYGRPSARGRTMLGGSAIPYGKLWRTGANEPTTFTTPVALKIAGMRVPAGTYSLYTVPNAGQWEIIVNRSTTQWGEESGYTREVQAQEVGRAKVKAETVKAPVETFTIRSTAAGGGANLILEWEKTRVTIPVTSG